MDDNSSDRADLRWSQESRLRAIDETVFWEGQVNRAFLQRRFGISVPQATLDLRRYQALAPANLFYDTRRKTYVATAGFVPLFGTPSAEAWLAAEEGIVAAGLPVEAVPLPVRRVDPWLLRRLLAVRRDGRAVRVLYQSMAAPDAAWCWISPAAVAWDGTRWQMRAFNHDAGRFEDLLFPRMLEVAEERPAEPLPADDAWERVVIVRLRPAGRLSPGQAAVIAADYGMVDGEVAVPVRAALLFLFVLRLRLDRGDSLVEIANRGEVDAAMEEIALLYR